MNATESSASEPALLSATGLTVRFGAVRALDGVDFELARGQIHALMGENGAGKSTLIKCLTGVVAPIAGEIRLAGTVIRPTSPHHAEALGIATVFQEVGLIPHLSIAENVCLGREPLRWGWMVNWRKVRARAQAALARLGHGGIDVRRELGSCSVAVQQLVAIARALDVRAGVLILDEPTSSLDRHECRQLFQTLRGLREQGMGIVFISHFLEQVEAIADRVTVLRDGRLVGAADMRSLTRSRLVSMMVGREFESLAAKPASSVAIGTEALLQAKGLGRAGALEKVDLTIAPGEAVGLSGLLGSGRTETARLLFGADQPTSGEIRADGAPVRLASPRAAIAKGIALTPENRKAEGVCPSLSVLDNIVLALQAKRRFFDRLPRAQQRTVAENAVRSLGIKAPDIHSPIARLSGGNQQKALLARWLATEPRLLILDEPTRGIDIAAKADVLHAVEQMRGRGVAILFISSELEEIVRACSRVVVLRDRRSVAELRAPDITEEAILSAVTETHG